MQTQFQKYVNKLKKRGLTQRIIAEKLGCSETFISQCMHRHGRAGGYKYISSLEMYVKGFEELDRNPGILNGVCPDCGNPTQNSIRVNDIMICAKCRKPL